MNNNNLDALLSALSDSLSDEELLLSVLQADIAARITSARASKSLSPKELADSMGVSQGLVSRWESGDVNFTLQTLARIALKLGIEMKSPYIPALPPHYRRSGNITPFPETSSWGRSVVYTPKKYETIDELKEM